MAVQEITLANSQKLHVRVFKGQVIHQQRHKYAEVSQGRATVGPDYVIPGQIYTNTVTEQEIWLRSSDGEEKMFDISNFDVPALPGHQMAVTLVKLDSTDWKISRVNNLSTGRSHNVKPFTKPDFRQAGRGKHFLQLFLVGGPILGLIVGAVAAYFWVECTEPSRYFKEICQPTTYWTMVSYFVAGGAGLGFWAGLTGDTGPYQKAVDEALGAIYTSG